MENKLPRILILDDDSSLLVTLVDILKGKGYEPIPVKTGAAALAKVEQVSIDVALIDLRLGDISGLEALKGIKTRCPKAECILMTGYASLSSAIEAIQLGAYGFFQKPFDMEELLLSIYRALEKNSTEEALRQIEARYRLLTNNISDVIWTLDLESGRFTYISPSVQQLRGFTVEEALAQDLSLSFTPASLETIQKVFPERLAESNQGNNIDYLDEVEQPTKDGKTVWTEIITHFMFNTGSNHWEINGVSHDITRRKKAENELISSEERYHTLFSMMDEGFCVVELIYDPEGKPVDYRFVETNPAFEKHTGLQQALGKTIRQIVSQNGAYWFEILWKVARTGEPIQFEIPVKALQIFYDVFAFRIGGDGSPRVGVIINDITQRKKNEKALTESYSTLQNILENNDDLIFSLNRLYCYTSFNRAHAVTMKQLYNLDIQIGGNLLEYMTVDKDRNLAKQNLDRALAGETLVDEAFSGDEALTRLFFEVSHTPIMTKTGEVIGVSVFSKNITARKQMELSLRNRLLELETVNDLSISLRAGKNVKELLHILLTETLKSANTSDGCIFLADPAENKLKLVEYRGWFEGLLGFSFQFNEDIVGHVFSANEPYISADIQNDELVSSQIGALIPVQSGGIFLPIHSENDTIGVLILSYPLKHVISKNELHLLTIITQMGANAISRTRLQDQAQAFSIELQNEIHQKILIQELLASEKELLSTTLMSIADGVIVTDREGLVLLINQAAELITGYAFSEVFKKPVNNFFKILNVNSLDPVPDVINYLMDLEKTWKTRLEYRSTQIINKTGERILISGSITTLKSADLEEKTGGYVLVFQNINEKQKIEAENLLSQKMEAIGQLAAGIAHEINTPIQYVGDNIEFFQKAFSKYSETLVAYQKVFDEHIEKPLTRDELNQIAELFLKNKISFFAGEIPIAIQDALDGIERVRKIVLAIREFSHPSEKEKNFADVNHGIETTIIISKNEWKYCADLETDLDKGLPKVYCQIDEINQVVLNLIINAAQAIQEKIAKTSDQKGKIIISTRKREDKVVITIRDTGNGIPPEIRARIFDPFFTTKGVGKGTGQGLSMAHNIIVKKHHGMIDVDSEVGQGTTFTIELPIDPFELEK